jgi:hypothetical protein
MYMLILNVTYPLRCRRVPLGVRVPPVEYHCLRTYSYVRGPFEKFVDSPYYSESDLCGGAVTVFFRTPYNALPTSRRRAADRLPQASGG